MRESLFFWNGAGPDPGVHTLGGKGFNLWKIHELSFNGPAPSIPPFFIIPVSFVKRWLAPFQSEINDLLTGEIIPDKIAQLRANILAMEIPESELNYVLGSCDHFGDFGPEWTVSVRSSAAVEDGSSASFAGQFATELYVKSDTFIQALKNVIASPYHEGVLTYLRLNGFKETEIPFAVIIQKMISATRSGVGFSMLPGRNLANKVIVAGYGAGEGIVSDRVPTDSYLVSRLDGAIQKMIGIKNEKLEYSDSLGIQPVPEDLAAAPALSDVEIESVSQLIQIAEETLKCPADIEFCFDELNELHLLQMRPVTTLSGEEICILDNTNIVESYPGITLPLTFDFANNAYEKLFRSSAKAFWISKKVEDSLKDVFPNLIAHAKGRIYYRLDNWYRMLSLVHHSKSSMKAWENAVGLKNSELERLVKNFRGKIRATISAIWLILNYRKGNRKFYIFFQKYYSGLRNIDSIANEPKKLWEHYNHYTSRLFENWYLTIVNDFLAFKAFGWVQALLKKYDCLALANDLVSNSEGVESEEAVLEVLRLKKEILSDAQLSHIFEENVFAIPGLLSKNEHAVFYHKFNLYLDRFGDRNLAELKLETPGFRNNPHLFAGLLKQQLSSNVTIDNFVERKKEIYHTARFKIKRILPSWKPNRWLLEFCLLLSRYGLKNRENMRFCRTRVYGAVKDIFLSIGECMVKEDVIENAEDVFYLVLQDLEKYCLYKESSALKTKISNAKSDFLSYEKLYLPDRIMYIGELPEFNPPQATHSNDSGFLRGIGVSQGAVTAEAIVVLNPSFDLDIKNKILVTKMTDPGWVFLMAQASGLISEKGSLLSHTAIVGRELGIPVVVNVSGATTQIKNGDILQLNGSSGIILMPEFIDE